MNALLHLSDIMIPALLFFLVGYGLCARVKVYEAFLKGAEDGLKTVLGIVPTLAGLMIAVSVLRASGLLEQLGRIFAPLTEPLGLPGAVFPVLLVKLFSSSAATGLVLDIFRTAGPDSYTGMLTSILMSCTETLFYTMSVYYLAVRVTKTRFTLAGALWSTLISAAASILITLKLFTP